MDFGKIQQKYKGMTKSQATNQERKDKQLVFWMTYNI